MSPQGSVLSLVLFSIFVSDKDSTIESTLSTFADSMSCVGKGNMQRGTLTTLRDGHVQTS